MEKNRENIQASADMNSDNGKKRNRSKTKTVVILLLCAIALVFVVPLLTGGGSMYVQLYRIKDHTVGHVNEFEFQGCNSLVSVTVTGKTLGRNGFSECLNLTTVIIGDETEYIGTGAFENCVKLTDVTLGTGLTKIAEDVFNGCDIKNLYITDIEKWCNVTFGNFAYDTHGSSPLADNIYVNGVLLTELVIPESVTTVSWGVFTDCKSISCLTIPDTVTEISAAAFSNCDGITSVVIPDSVTKLDAFAFESCDSLTSVTVGNGVTVLLDGVFGKCKNLTGVTLGNGIKKIDGRAFGKSDNLTSITFNGTKAEWDKIEKINWWHASSIQTVICTDGEVTLQ